MWTLPAATFDGTELSRVAVSTPIAPIDDLDELIEVAAQVLEDAADADDPKRVFDALSHLCDQRPDDLQRRIGPLAKRADQLSQRRMVYSGEGPGSDLCGLIHSWATGTCAASPGGHNGTIGALSRRAHALSVRVADRTAGPLLSAPTHTGGLIDPVVFGERVNAWSNPAPDDLEVVIALLRLAPERRVQRRAGLNSRIDPVAQAAFPGARPNVGEPAQYDIVFALDIHENP